MLEILEETSGDMVAFRVSGKHIHDESHKLAGMIDARISKHGHVNCFVEIMDTKGIALSALKEGLEFDMEHGTQIERCGVVGDQAWERWLVRLLGLFFRSAEIKFYDPSERAAALDWVRGA
jgi:hypothetical protein